MRTPLAILIAASFSLIGCFDSLIDSPCIDGYELAGGTCVARAADVDASVEPTVDAPEVTPDGHVVATTDAPDAAVEPTPDAPACSLDLTSDPNNCGSCGHVCASGLCTAGQCEGEYAGHIVAIGHDFTASNVPMRRVLANAAALGPSVDLAIAHYAPSGSSSTASTAALTTGLAELGRSWHAVTLDAPSMLTAGTTRIDVLVVDPLHGDPDAVSATGAAWQLSLDRFLEDGGIVILLESAGTVTYRFAAGAGLYSVDAPEAVSGTPALVIDPADAVVNHVLSPYLAAPISVAYPIAPAPVITTATGAALVFHLTR